MLDQIIGCGQRNGNKFFLVRFKGQDETEIIDWETAKQYSIDVMEFFGSRIVWSEMQNIIDPDMHGDLQDTAEQDVADEHAIMPSTSRESQLRQLDELSNELEFDE